MKRIFILFMTLMMIPALAFGTSSALKPGSTGENVVQLQKRLNELGLGSGEADGIYGEKTASAVEAAQRLLAEAGYDIIPSGTADTETLALILSQEAESALLTLRKGSSGTRVRELQNRLIDLGLLRYAADGAYGSRTEAAVMHFQQLMHLEQNGAVSAEAWDLMFSDLSGAGFDAPVYFDKNAPLSLKPDFVYAPAFILIDAPSGQVLMERDADKRMYPASTTKIMTLLLALEKADLDQNVVIPDAASQIPTDSSLVPVTPGEEMSMRDLLYGLMIRSGNDAANAVADWLSGSVDGFVQEMNDLAEELGMADSHFVNPHGYHHADHYTTARDLSIAARKGLTDPVFCQIVTCLNYTMAPTAKRDALVLQNIWELFDPASEYYIPGAAGVKSGYTSAAGFCYVGAAQRDGRTLIAVVLGEPTRSRAWLDLSRLFEYGFAL